MSTNASAVDEFLEVWKGSLQEAIAEACQLRASLETLDSATSADLLLKRNGSACRVVFAASGSVRGTFVVDLSEGEALQLGRALKAQPGTQVTQFSDEHRDAVMALIRRAAEQVARRWQPRQGGTVSLRAVGEESGPSSAVSAGLRVVAANNLPEVAFLFGFSDGFSLSFGATQAPGASSKAPSPPAGPDLGVLFDVPLEATIRFGERNLLLRDILSMGAGSVVELDRQINDVAELLVAGRVVARGEVVVVEGNFGMRVTELERQPGRGSRPIA